MKFILVLCSILLCGCATQAPINSAPPLFHDALFESPKVSFDPQDIFKLDPEMIRYLKIDLAPQRKFEGDEVALYNALYDKTQVRISYDARRTKTASETFRDRTGNCLSLLIMTAAFSKEMGFPVSYQEVQMNEQWSNIKDLYFVSRHVNILIGKKPKGGMSDFEKANLLKIDFLSPHETKGQRTTEISENTVVAMYLNNRAAEVLAERKYAQAYWWLRHAIQIDPLFAPAYNTLGITYWRAGHYQHAIPALEYSLTLEPDNLSVMSNLAQAYPLNGEIERGEKLAQYVKEHSPAPYLHYFRLGKDEMRLEHYSEAKALFVRELEREPEHHEVHFWLALANYRLSEFREAEKHMSKAKEFSYTEAEKTIYSSKLNAMRRISY